MFADDTSIFLSEKSVANLQAKGNAELLNIDTWFTSKELSLNNKYRQNQLHAIQNKSHYYQTKVNNQTIS